MKKITLFFILSFTLGKVSVAQVLCIDCYRQNDSISSGVHNLLLNGGFENTPCTPWNGTIYSWCPNSSRYACDIANWTSTGGGPNSYPCMMDSLSSGETIIVEGGRAAYFGNSFCYACSGSLGDTSCLHSSGCTVTGFPPGYPTTVAAFGGSAGVGLEQTVNGLIPGNVYVLEFWTGGEAGFNSAGIFAVNVGFGDTLLRDYATPRIGGIGTTYIVQFKATSSSHIIKFTNWGHICWNCTELMLDNVRLYTLAELSPIVPSCAGAITLPVPDFKASDSIICAKNCINFSNKSTNATSWQWSFAGGKPSTSTDRNPQNICYLAEGIYDVKLVASNSGATDSITFSNYIKVKTSPPTPAIKKSNDTLFCSFDSSYTSYQWYVDSTPKTGATQSFLVYTYGVNYNVKVTNGNGCSTSAGIILGLPGYYSGNSFSIFPNPAANQITIHVSSINWKSASVSIINLLGQEFSPPVALQSRGEDALINVSKLPSGIYFLQLKSESSNATKMFVKE